MTEKIFSTLVNGENKTNSVRFQIVEATIDLLGSGEGDDLSFETIGKKVGISRALVKHYFPSKDDLIDLCLVYIAAVAENVVKLSVEKAKSPKEKIIAYCDASFQWAHIKGYTAAIVFLYFRTTHSKKMKTLHSELRRSGTERVLQLLTLCFPKEEKEVLQIKATQIYFTVTSLLLEKCTTNFKGGKERCKVLVEDILKSIRHEE